MFAWTGRFSSRVYTNLVLLDVYTSPRSQNQQPFPSYKLQCILSWVTSSSKLSARQRCPPSRGCKLFLISILLYRYIWFYSLIHFNMGDVEMTVLFSFITICKYAKSGRY